VVREQGKVYDCGSGLGWGWGTWEGAQQGCMQQGAAPAVYCALPLGLTSVLLYQHGGCFWVACHGEYHG
jgi:hypothetical protein